MIEASVPADWRELQDAVARGNPVEEGNYRCTDCGEVVTMPLPMEDFILPLCPRCGGDEFEGCD